MLGLLCLLVVLHLGCFHVGIDLIDVLLRVLDPKDDLLLEIKVVWHEGSGSELLLEPVYLLFVGVTEKILLVGGELQAIGDTLKDFLVKK